MPSPQPSRAPRALLRSTTLVALALGLAAPAAAQDESPAPMMETMAPTSAAPMAGSAAPMSESPAPMMETMAPASAGRADLPPGWQPEGITSLGDQLYVGSLADGAIWRIDAATREGSMLVPGSEGSVAVGVEADEPNGRLWVAGGNTGEVRAYAVDSGELLATFAFEGGFLNDLVFTGDAVYVTDSNVQQLGVIPLAADGALPDPSQATTLPLTGDLVYQEDAFNANGIVAGPAGLVLVQSGTGGLFRVDPATGETTAIDTGAADLTSGDGLELRDGVLYVSRNQAEVISTLQLDDTFSSAALLSEATSEDLDVPSTLALHGDDLWIVNARFGTEATPETQYWVSIWPGARPAE